MINSKRKTVLTGFVMMGTVIIILSIAQSFKGFNGSPVTVKHHVVDSIYNIKSFDLPEEVTFAGEKMPLENFDTRESLEREILISAYRHSSSILIIMKAHRYLPLIEKILKKNNIASRIDPERGFDHGLFIPLKLMYPEADIPSLQLSLLRGLNPAAHITLGKALRELMNENILVIGSGFSFHNQNAFFGQTLGAPDPANEDFQDWLIETCAGPISQAEREQRLMEWEKAPSARYCHPREEHLLPLHVCLGMADKPAATLLHLGPGQFTVHPVNHRA